MAPPSALTIAAQSVQRLVKEESYYHKEQASQEARIQKLEEDIKTKAGTEDLDQNAEYMLKQEQKALAETKNVFSPLHQRIADAVQKLEEQLAISESDGTASEEEIKKAKEALEAGQKIAEKED
ncbi:tubulin binding cofactor A [Diplogelasinospora grovesii]|uniref:Tubulin-specific chaperone A n=1 Tax=Diplogelasinospora grovesii TaxID=303347 RepID=A0AAN6NBI5_9PEZI|nr:tubulin binding cofactor A [Diplogelasinospora grovesii]